MVNNCILKKNICTYIHTSTYLCEMRSIFFIKYLVTKLIIVHITSFTIYIWFFFCNFINKFHIRFSLRAISKQSNTKQELLLMRWCNIMLVVSLGQPMTKNKVPNFFVYTFDVICYSKREKTRLSLFYSNCDNNKNKSKEMLYLVFSQRLMQRNKHKCSKFSMLALSFSGARPLMSVGSTSF